MIENSPHSMGVNRRLVAWFFVFLLLFIGKPSLKAEAMLQYFNTTWAEITGKIPELAEAGYSSLWLPPPTKGSGGLSVGYDLWDPFDLGLKDQRGSIKTRYGTEAELLTLMETAHRFGIRVYFDNIMNHRAFDVPGFNEFTSIGIYPGMVPEDFHLKVTQDGFYRKWDNTRSWNDTWQVQNLGLADLIDIAQEPGTTNFNFGTSEGSTGPKIKFVRDPLRPDYYCYLPNGTYVGFGPNNGITTQMLAENPEYYGEYVQDYLNRAARWLMDRTKADGLRLDAVKHIRADFFGATFGVDKDTSDYGYTGQVQRQFNLSRGFTDTNHRNSLFQTEIGRDDAMLFGEHLGEPPAYGPYIDAGMRLVDNPLRQQFNDRLGSPWNGLQGFDKSGYGGFSATTGVMHAQSHDSDYAARRELQHAFYFLREGMGLLYTDGNYQAETLGESGGAFPRHANTSFLGQWDDARVPNLLYIHDQFARGGQRGVWSDEDLVAWTRTDYREGGMSEADATTMFVLLNDNYAFGRKINDKPGSGGANVGFNAGDYLYNYSTYGGGFYKYGSELKDLLAPVGGYFVMSWKNPDPSNLWKNAGGKTLSITQAGQEVGMVSVTRRDGPNGDPAFKGTSLPAESRPELPVDGVTTDYKYTALVPRVTDGSAVKFIARTDGSAENILMKLDGGINLNTTNHVLGDSRDHPPGVSTDTFMGYEQPNFVSRIHPELFAAMNTGVNNTTGSAGAETYTATSGAVSFGHGGKTVDGDTPVWVYHDPNNQVGNILPARNQFDSANHVMWVKTNNVGGNYFAFLYYVPDGVGNPEGAAGQGIGATKIVQIHYSHNDDGGNSNWWKTNDGELPMDFTSSSKYKIGVFKGRGNSAPESPAPSWKPLSPGAVQRKTQMMSTFETNQLDLTSIQYKVHADYGGIETGLKEGFHVIRARAFLDRLGKASIYNTFTQTFYYDAERPSGEIRFPFANGETIGGSEYGAVVRTDPSVTEVWYHIDDGDTSNDDTTTRAVAGNGEGFEPFTDANSDGLRDPGEAFEDLNNNGVWDGALPVSWVKATEVTPSTSFAPGDPSYTKEWRFNYTNIPATGSATLKVRLREISSSPYEDFALSDSAGHYTTLERNINTAGPDIRMFVAYPSSNGERIGDGYVMKTYFTKALADGLSTQDLIERFTIRIGGNDQSGPGTAQSRDDFSINYNGDNGYPYHELAFTIPNMYNDQPEYLHKIEVVFDRNAPAADLVATRLVKFFPSQIPKVSIVTPVELASDGRPYEIILPAKSSPSPDERQYLVRVSTGLEATNVVMSVNSGPVDFITPPVTSIEGNTKYWDFTWQNIVEGEFRFTATVETATPGLTASDTRNAKVIFRQLLAMSVPDPDDDDDGLLDGDEATAVPLPNGYLPGDPKYKPNPEQWNNGEVHIHNAFGRSNPHSPDTDGDGLPDALEVGWRQASIVGEEFQDTGYGDPLIGAGNQMFDWNDANGNGVHDVGEASESFTDSDSDGKFKFGTILSRDTDGDGVANFAGDVDPPFYNTLDNIAAGVPDVNSASEGGDRAKQLWGSTTNPSNPDTDGDGILDGVEDANKNGWLDGDGSLLAAAAAPSSRVSWPDGIRNPGEVWTETNPNNADTDSDGLPDGYGEDKNGNGSIAGDINNNRVFDNGEIWSETDPLNRDTEGDGLSDGWEDRYGLDPLDNGLVSYRADVPDIDNGPDGDPDEDGFTNLQELSNGTNPREDDTIPPPPPGSIEIGPKTPVVSGGVINNREFTDWTIDDLIALDEYDGDGRNNQGGDVYHGGDGFDSSRDLVAFYAHDGGNTSMGGDGQFYFRVDMQDLKPLAENGNLDIYVVIDFNSPGNGESALPDDIDTRTEMKWEAVVACYSIDNGAVYLDMNTASNSTGIGQNLTSFGVVRRTQADTDGFKNSHYNSNLDAVEFSISRKALTDAGWNGNANTLNYQVYTTRDGTQNSPTPGAGDIGGRSDIRDSIEDDFIASDYWRDQGNISGSGSVMYSWFGRSANNDRFQRTKVISLVHESRPILPGSEVHAIINTGGSAGFYRPLDLHQAYSVPMALHMPATLASAIQWASVDVAAAMPWRDGPAFNDRIASMLSAGTIANLGTTYADHVASYFPLSFTQQSVVRANETFASIYGQGASSNVFYPSERVLDSDTLEIIKDAGFGYTFADQMRHVVKWFGRSSALANDGYRINRVNGMKMFVINDQASSFRFQNNDGGLNLPLRELFSRKARSGNQDQVIILHSDWSDFLNKAQADAYDLNMQWLASRPWIQLVTPQMIANGEVDGNADGVGEQWGVVERGTQILPKVAKDYIDHATQENYDNWYFGQSGREESLADKVFEQLPGVPLPQAFGRVGTYGLADASWSSLGGVIHGGAGLKKLADDAMHSAMYLTAFHNQSNNDLSKFSTGAYISPDTSFQNLADFSKVAQSQVRWASVYQRVSQWAQAANGGAYDLLAQTEAADVDMDGQNEYLLFNDRIFGLLETTGGRMTAAWVRDISNGNVFQVVGNPISYSGSETEEEGEANVVGSAVASFRTSAFKDWYAGGLNTNEYNNAVYVVTPIANGWMLKSADNNITKSITLENGANAFKANYQLLPAVTNMFVRHGLSPDLADLLVSGQENLDPMVQVGGSVNLVNQGDTATVRAYVGISGAGLGGASWNSLAVDDNPGASVNFSTVNMRNQAQTHQLELTGGSGMTFTLGFETGPTLSLDTDGDLMPDVWENANGLSSASGTGDDGAQGNPDGDGLSNLQEYVFGTNPQMSDSYSPMIEHVPAGFSISFPTVPYRTYRVLYSNTLGGWENLSEEISGDGSVMTVTDDGSTSDPHPNVQPRRFYKVQVQLNIP